MVSRGDEEDEDDEQIQAVWDTAFAKLIKL